jgi:NAD(P)-dependent dehydrogenase (short-subunit alcohol dehydrogenase family)
MAPLARLLRRTLLLLACLAPALVAQDVGPVALITGSTDGLGREVALRTAAMGFHVIVHGRDQARGDSVVAAIKARGGSAQFLRADLSDFGEVRRLAADVLAEHPRLRLLVNNAGIYPSAGQRRSGPAGAELTFTVNYLSGFLLTRLLLPALVHEAPTRIINVASRAQQPLDFSDPQLTRGYSDGRAYAQSKLAQITFTMDLGAQLTGTSVRVVAVHPANMMPTGMVVGRGATPQSTLDEGADAVMNLLELSDIPTGTYYNGPRQAQAHAQAYDAEAQRALRALSERLTGAPPLPPLPAPTRR